MGSDLGRRSVILGGGAAVAGAAAAVGASAIGPTPAGAAPFAPLYVAVGPVRVYDTRDGDGRIFKDQTRNLFAGELDPNFYFALGFNVTITGTASSSGFLSLYPGDFDWPGSSSLNWFGVGQTLANNALTNLAVSDGSINVRCGALSGGSTHFILDVIAAVIFVDLADFDLVSLQSSSALGSSGLDTLNRLQETVTRR